MHKIFKFLLREQEEPQAISMPREATILHIGQQGASLALWAKVKVPYVGDLRTFRVFGTGMVIDEQGKYVGTVQMSTGYVWHIYEL